MTTITETPIPMDVIDMYVAAYGEEVTAEHRFRTRSTT